MAHLRQVSKLATVHRGSLTSVILSDVLCCHKLFPFPALAGLVNPHSLHFGGGGEGVFLVVESLQKIHSFLRADMMTGDVSAWLTIG